MRKLLVYQMLLFAALFMHVTITSGGETTYVYDEVNRLERVNNDEYVIDYFYDAVGNRTSKMTVIVSPSFDQDHDGDIDGLDLAVFAGSGEVSEKLAQFSDSFGQ
jgi:uncharacterized protein RhaS with RHS repeats